MAVKVHWFQIEPNLKEWEYQFTGLSTDEKPQDPRVAANSLFLELDTGDFYYCKSQFVKGEAESVIIDGEKEFYCNQNYENNIYYKTMLYGEINDDNLTIIFDGITYECEKMDYEDGHYYGSSLMDFNDYPFTIFVGEITSIYTDNQDTHIIAIYREITAPDTPAVWEKVGSGGVTEPDAPDVS